MDTKDIVIQKLQIQQIVKLAEFFGAFQKQLKMQEKFLILFKKKIILKYIKLK